MSNIFNSIIHNLAPGLGKMFKVNKAKNKRKQANGTTPTARNQQGTSNAPSTGPLVIGSTTVEINERESDQVESFEVSKKSEDSYPDVDYQKWYNDLEESSSLPEELTSEIQPFASKSDHYGVQERPSISSCSNTANHGSTKIKSASVSGSGSEEFSLPPIHYESFVSKALANKFSNAGFKLIQ